MIAIQLYSNHVMNEGGDIKMSENKLKELLKKVESDLEARKKVEDLEKPADEKGVIAYYLEVAKRLGADLTEEDIQGALAEMLKEQQSKTETAVKKVEAMAEDDLADVAGGCGGGWGKRKREDLPDKCLVTYAQKENCWLNDGCDIIVMQYASYSCSKHYY